VAVILSASNEDARRISVDRNCRQWIG
jgi:hypothetical protein